METLGFTSVTTCVDEGNRYLQCVFGSWNTLLALQKRARFRRQILWFVPLFSRVWYACFECWIQLANFSAQDRSERFFDTTLRR